eukprot:3135204-Pyramimonas_sp.AAC.1
MPTRSRSWGSSRWRPATLNMNAFSNLDRCLTEQISGCNVLLFQEARLSGARTTDAEGELRRRGWRAA